MLQFFYQGSPDDGKATFEAAMAMASLRAHFDDSTIRNSFHVASHNRKKGINETVSQLACELEKQFIRLGIQESYYKLLIFLDGLLQHLQFEVRKTGPTLYESAKELARNIEAALNEQARKTTSAVSAFQEDFNPTRYEQQLDNLTSQSDKMQASL